MAEEKTKPVELGDAVVGCAASVGKMLLQIALIPWAALVATTIWRWFAVGKLGAPAIPFAVMGGLMEGASLIRLRGTTNKDDKTTVTSILTGHVLVPAIILGLARAWLVFT